MSSRGAPAWLFSHNTDNNSSDTAAAAAVARGGESGVPDRYQSTAENMAKKSKKSGQAAPRAKRQTPAAQPPAQLMDMVEQFLADSSFSKAYSAFKKQRRQSGLSSGSGALDSGQTLLAVYRLWKSSQGKAGRKVEPEDADSSSDKIPGSGSSSGSSSDSSSSGSESSSNSSSEAQQASKKPPAGLKRKAPASISSGSSSSDSDSSSGSDSKPRVKKQKTAAGSESDSDSDSDSDSSSSDGGKMNVDEASPDSASDSESDSESDSDSDSDSDSSASAQAAAKVPLPESGSSSESSSDADSEDDEKSKAKPSNTKVAAAKEASDSSETLDTKSPEPKALTSNPPLPPDPVTAVANGHKKKQNERFSRIPKNIKVDSKFASNDYVAMDYSQRAYQDLVVTKGKGFTKEKNKKKRGKFQGGMIDIHEKKGVYFDD